MKKNHLLPKALFFFLFDEVESVIVFELDCLGRLWFLKDGGFRKEQGNVGGREGLESGASNTFFLKKKNSIWLNCKLIREEEKIFFSKI